MAGNECLRFLEQNKAMSENKYTKMHVMKQPRLAQNPPNPSYEFGLYVAEAPKQMANDIVSWPATIPSTFLMKPILSSASSSFYVFSPVAMS